MSNKKKRLMLECKRMGEHLLENMLFEGEYT